MRISPRTLGIAILATGLVSAVAIRGASAGASGDQEESMMGRGMMGGMMQGDMGQMMEHCSKMMQSMADGGSGRPNEQWRKEEPSVPEKKD